MQEIQNIEEHPVPHRLRQMGEFVRDYWDLAAVITAGIALCDNEGKLLGDYVAYRHHLVSGGTLAGIIGPGIDYLITGREASWRFRRNFFGGISAYLTTLTGYFISEGNITLRKPADMGYLASNIFPIVFTYLSDRWYRKENRPIPQKLQAEVQ